MFYYAYECKSGMAVYNDSIHEYVCTNIHLKVLRPIRSNVRSTGTNGTDNQAGGGSYS